MPTTSSRSAAFVGGRVVPVSGPPVEGGVVLVLDGRVAAVGERVDVPDGVERVDVRGRWVLPGFVEAHAHLGVHEEGEGWEGNDTNEMTDPVGARMKALDGINPADTGFADALSGGVTTAVVKPGSGNPIGGQAVALKCWGRVVDEMVVRDPVSMKSALGENPKRVYGDRKALPSTRMGVAAVIRDALTAAQDYRERRAAAAEKGEPFARDRSLEALALVLDGEIPWCQHAHRADDIATAVRLSEEFGYRLVLNHATEGHLLADWLAEKGVDCVVGPLLTSKSKVELRQRHLRTSGVLAAAGVRVAITTDHPVVPIQFLVHQATLAVKEGLDRDVALRALTTHPAAMLGVDDRVGALAPGLDGDVVVWSGDPLDVMSRAEQVWIGGRLAHRWDAEAGEGVVLPPR